MRFGPYGNVVVPLSNAFVVVLVLSSGGATDTTICLDIVPSLFRNFCGALVERRLICESRLCNCDAPPGPAPGFPPCGITKMSLSG